MNFPTENRKPKTVNGFTLIEIMVAVAIFSMIVAAICSTWYLVLKASRSGQEAAARAQRERIAIHTLEDSLQCIQCFQASLAYYSFIVQNSGYGDEPMLSFVARVPEIFPRNGKFGDFNVRRLTFAIEQDKTDHQQKDLVLRQSPILMDMDADEQNYPLILARNVKDFVVECWDTNQMEWVTTWDDTNSIPPIMRVTLSFGGNADSTKAQTSITREISIESGMVPTIVQTPRGQFGGTSGRPTLQVPGGGGGGPPNQNQTGPRNSNGPRGPRGP